MARFVLFICNSNRSNVEIDALLEAVRLSNSFHITIRSIQKHFAYYKASELRIFLFYLLEPIMKQFMKQVYFEHAMLFSDAIKLLNGITMTKEDILIAEQKLVEFVLQFQKLYGEQYVENIYS